MSDDTSFTIDIQTVGNAPGSRVRLGAVDMSASRASVASGEVARAEHTTCIVRLGRVARCGRPLAAFEFTFQSADHARAARRAGSRLLACPKCVASI
jgi:hypothetical protein